MKEYSVDFWIVTAKDVFIPLTSAMIGAYIATLSTKKALEHQLTVQTEEHKHQIANLATSTIIAKRIEASELVRAAIRLFTDEFQPFGDWMSIYYNVGEQDADKKLRKSKILGSQQHIYRSMKECSLFLGGNAILLVEELLFVINYVTAKASVAERSPRVNSPSLQYATSQYFSDFLGRYSIAVEKDIRDPQISSPTDEEIRNATISGRVTIDEYIARIDEPAP